MRRAGSSARTAKARTKSSGGVAFYAGTAGKSSRRESLDTVSLHAAYIAWVIFGAFFTRGRLRLAALHVATLVDSVIVEIFGFWCPLTTFETWLDVRGGVSAYRGPFLLHYLDAVVYPNIPPNLLISGAVAVCILNLWIYARRVRVRHSLG